jgi:hypothetical protein
VVAFAVAGFWFLGLSEAETPTQKYNATPGRPDAAPKKVNFYGAYIKLTPNL